LLVHAGFNARPQSGFFVQSGQAILVTGGGSGLGTATGRRFLALGAELVICGRKLDRLFEATAAEMRAQIDGKVTTIACDIRDGAAVDGMMDQIWREAPLDVLVSNAAATFIARSEHLSFRAANAILAPTLRGAIYCTGEHAELADLASFPASDRAGHINGEMVVIDAARICVVPARRICCAGPTRNGPRSAPQGPRTRFRCRAFALATSFRISPLPAISKRGQSAAGPSSSHNIEGTTPACGGCFF
jgi:hypothetical protein